MLADILLVIADDWAKHDLEQLWADGHLPNLQALADSGTYYTNCYSSPLCSPSRYALYGGEWGRRRGILYSLNPYEDDLYPSEIVTLADVAKSAGYTTGLFGKWHLGGPPHEGPMNAGFDTWLAGVPSNITGGGGASYSYWFRVDDGLGELTTGYVTVAQILALHSWWNTTPSPKFAVLSVCAPHGPLHTPPPQTLPPGYVVGPGSRGKFEAMCETVDRALGSCMAKMNGIGQSWVIFVTDNGTADNSLEPGYPAGRGKTTTYERGIRVPLIVYRPDGEGGGADDSGLRHLSDLQATISDITSQPCCAGPDSRSLLGAPHPYVISEAIVSPEGEPVETVQAVVREDGYKLIVDATGEHLFYLPTDSGEQADLVSSPDHQGVLMELRTLLASG